MTSPENPNASDDPLVEQARAALRRGEAPKAIANRLTASGARDAAAIVEKAVRLDWELIVAAASRDLAAGVPDSPAIKRCRQLAARLAMEKPAGKGLSLKLAAYGASEELSALLGADPEVRRQGLLMPRLHLVAGAVSLIVAGIVSIVLPPSEAPFAGGVLAGAGVLLVVLGWRGMRRG